MSKTMRDLIQDYLDLEEELWAAEDDDERAKIKGRIAAARTLVIQKAEKVDQFVVGLDEKRAELEGIYQFRKAEAEKVNRRIKAIDRTQEWIKLTMLPYVIEKFGMNGTLEVNGSTYKLQEQWGKVEVKDKLSVPLEYRRIIPESWEINKVEVRKAIAAGTNIPGVSMPRLTKGVRR